MSIFGKLVFSRPAYFVVIGARKEIHSVFRKHGGSLNFNVVGKIAVFVFAYNFRLGSNAVNEKVTVRLTAVCVFICGRIGACFARFSQHHNVAYPDFIDGRIVFIVLFYRNFYLFDVYG